MEASFEVGQDPKGAVASYMDACVDEWVDGWMVTDKPEGGFGDLKNTVVDVNNIIVRDLRLIQRCC
jgi:hypothetical protein